MMERKPRTGARWVPVLLLVACGQNAGTQPPFSGGSGQVAGGSSSGSGNVQGGTQSGGDAGLSGGTSPASGGASQSSGGRTQGGGGTSSAGGPSKGGSSNSNGGGVNASGGVAATGCPRACGPTYDQYFDEKKLATLRVKMSSVPTFSAAGHCKPYTWTSAQVVYESPDSMGNVTLDNVGFRLRGSRTQPVQGFKLDMQVLDTPGAQGKRRFADLNRVNILSNEGDHTHMLQCVGYKALRDFGIPAPRCNLMKVYLNDKFYGVLENVEQVNKGYLRRHFGSNSGSLYGGSMSNDGGMKSGNMCTGGFQDSLAKLVYTDDKFTSYSTQYELTHATAQEAEQNLIPMMKCAATAADADFKTCIADWIDVTEWLKLIAAESVMPELQSFTGYYRNYFMYFKADSTSSHQGRFVIWPWDLDTVLNNDKCSPSSCDPLTSVDSLYRSSRAKMVTRLTTVFRAEYCTQLKSFVSDVFKSSLADDFAKVAEPGMAMDPTDSTSAWQTAVSALSTYIPMRASAAQTSINSICQ